MSNVFRQFMGDYGKPGGEEGPVRLVREVFGAIPDPWQEKGLRAFGRGERRISMRSGHGVGKTAFLAWLIHIMLLTRYPQRSVATAPSKPQLEDGLVAEVLLWAAKLPPALQSLFDWKKNRVELKADPSGSFFSARTAREENPEALQGVHSDNVLLIADEASGVPEKIFEAAVGSMSGENATTVLASNPTRTSGLFYDTHHSLRHMWFNLHVSRFDCPRVLEDFEEDVAARYGKDSNAYRVRVLGEFPRSDDDTVIPFELVDSAQKRELVTDVRLKEVWSLDVARYGDDKSALIRRTSRAVLPDIQVWGKASTMETVGRIKALWDKTRESQRPIEILVDDIGLGGGVTDRGLELGLPIRGVNVSETAGTSGRYRNLRTELWFFAREWLETHKVSLPTGSPEAESLAGELLAPKYKYLSNGMIMVEPKDMTKKTIRRSPDVADAFVLSFAGDAATMMGEPKHDAGWSMSWDKPLVRKVAVV